MTAGDPKEHFERLSSAEPAVRLKACAHLLQIWVDARESVPSSVVEAVYRVLHDRDASVRGVVRRWLIERPQIVLSLTTEEKNVAAVTVSRAVLKAGDAEAIRGLTEIVGCLSGRAACQVLENAIDGVEVAEVANAAFALGRLSGYGGAVVEAIRHRDPVVRAAALFGVGDVETPQAPDADGFLSDLLCCLDDKGPLADLVRAKAAILVAPLRAIRAIPGLANAYLHGDRVTQHNARYALLLGGAEFADALTPVARSNSQFDALQAEVARLRAAAESPGSHDESHESQSPWFPIPVSWLTRADLEARGLL